MIFGYRLTARPLLAHHEKQVQALCESAVDYFEAVTGMAPGPSVARELLAAVPEGVDRARKHVFGLFTEHEELVGVVDVVRGYPTDTVWTIGLLLLAPDWRGRGVGRHVVEALLAWMRGEGAEVARLGVLTGSRARRFWERLGFSFEKQVELSIDGGSPRPFDVLTRPTAPKD